MDRKPYVYEIAFVNGVVDGDTFDATVELTPTLRALRRIRLRGVDSPEIRTKDPEEKRRGQFARACLVQLVEKLPCRLVLHGRDHYGRWVCDVSNDDYTDIAGMMVEMGAARPRRTNHERHEDTLFLYESEVIETRAELFHIEENQLPARDIQY